MEIKKYLFKTSLFLVLLSTSIPTVIWAMENPKDDNDVTVQQLRRRSDNKQRAIEFHDIKSPSSKEYSPLLMLKNSSLEELGLCCENDREGLLQHTLFRGHSPLKLMRKEISQHIIDYPFISTESGVEKTRNFLIKLENLIDNQLLLRADNNNFKNDILSIEKDYQKLKDIVSSDTDINLVHSHLIEIQKNYHEDLNTNLKGKVNMHDSCKTMKQIYCFEIIMGESKEFLEKMQTHLPVLVNKSFGAIQATIELQNKLYTFLIEYKSFMKEIELERRGFDLLLRRVCFNHKNIVFDSIVEDFPKVIEQYQQEALHVLISTPRPRSKSRLEQMKESVPSHNSIDAFAPEMNNERKTIKKRSNSETQSTFKVKNMQNLCEKESASLTRLSNSEGTSIPTPRSKSRLEKIKERVPRKDSIEASVPEMESKSKTIKKRSNSDVT